MSSRPFVSWKEMVLLMLVGMLGLSAMRSLSAQSSTRSAAGLTGVVKGADGKPMEGVAVTAREQSTTFNVSVFTNENGQYSFPAVSDGQYRIWAQAVGFDTARSQVSVAAGRSAPQDFQLKPLQDFHHQLSATEWTDSLPAGTPADRRMQQLIHNNCSSCHIAGFILSKRFDANGWAMMINYMLEREMRPEAANYKLIQSYKEDIAGYLAKVRGADANVMQWKPLPRVKGEATRVVVTEFDLPRGDMEHSVHDGSDWSAGIPSKYEGEAAHDSAMDKDGNVFFSDNSTPNRTIGKLDPKTGKVTGYMLADKEGYAVRTHGAVTDQKGIVWFTNGTDGTMLSFDPKSEKFKNYPKPPEITRAIGPTITVDSKGMLWSTQPNGLFKLNPQTGDYTEYKSFSKGGSPYGLAVDSEDNVWFAQITTDRVGYVDSQTGKVGEVVLPAWTEEVSSKDREIGERTGAITNAAPLTQKGPRRMGADRRGGAVWVAEYWTGQLAKIDIHTKKVTEYAVPSRYSHPYAVVVDKNHMVWVSLMNSDRIAKFDPFTEKFTEYPLATLGSEARYIDVDDTPQKPAVWLPYSRTNKLGRVEFR